MKRKPIIHTQRAMHTPAIKQCGNIMRKILVITVELLIVAAAIFSANYLQQHISFIPKSIIHLPAVDYSNQDFKIILLYFLVTHAVVFLLAQWLVGVWKASSAERTANELLALAAAFAASTLTVFITTAVNFDPNLMIAIAVCNAVLFILIHLIASLLTGHQVLTLFPQLIISTFKRLFSITGILILIFAVSPGILAKAFVSNRDVANIITQTRIFFSGQPDYEYSLVSAIEDYRFTQPMLAKTPPENDNVLYILERTGRIYRMSIKPLSEPEVVLDLRDKVGFVEMENGALGFDFHPDFSLSPGQPQRIYLYYTDVRNERQINRLSEFDLSSKSLQTRSNSESPLFELNRETSGFHNGGSVEFGPDGFLYIALGEGIRTPEYSSHVETLRMGILRIDVDKQGGAISKPITYQPKNGRSQNYFIPLDNPFINEEILEEYWALGLRNPFRMSFDQETGQLWAGDVGSTKWEEVNLIQRGNHYQFPFIEGYEKTQHKRPEQLFGQESPPIYTYFHTASERAVIGGVVYRGDKFPEFKGQYLFADNYASILYSMPTNKSKIDKVAKVARAKQFAQRGISSVSQLPDGSLIATTLGRAGHPTGEILKLVRGQHTDKQSTKTVAKLSKEEIRDIFATNCVRCHGASGRADGPDTALLGVKIADFSSKQFQQYRSDEKIRAIIAEGGPANSLSTLMPPWKNILTDDEIAGLVDYIRSLEQTKK